MEILTAVFTTSIIILLLILFGLTFQNKVVYKKNTNFVITLLISSCSILCYHFAKDTLLLLVYLLTYVLLSNYFLKELDIFDKLNAKLIFFVTIFFAIMEIVSFLIFPKQFIYLLFTFFLIFFLFTKLFLNLKKGFEDSIKTTQYIIFISIGIVLFINIFIHYYTILPFIHIYLLGYNLLFICIYTFLYLRDISNLVFSKEVFEIDTKKSEYKMNIEKISKYEKSAIDNNVADEILGKIESLKIEFFLNIELKQDDMARYLKISKHQLSQILNSKLEMNFQQFVNSKRVGYAELLLANTLLDIQSIALKSGFNSKVTFYRAFKNKNNISPKDFRILNKNTI